MREDIKIKTTNFNFKFRVSGVIIKNNKILVVDMDNSGFFCLPGGYVELGETTEKAIIREIKEETRYETKIKEFLGVVENYFINKYSKKIHEISFYYLMDTDIETKDFINNENDNGHNIKHNFKWIDIDNIDNYDIRPSFLKVILKNKNNSFNHLIFDDLK